MATDTSDLQPYLVGLFEGRDFQREAAQIQAKALLSEIADQMPEYRWTYVARRMVRNAVLASLAFQDIAENFPQQVGTWADRARKLALIWEALSILRESTNQRTALLNAAVNYEIAGYQANAAFIARKVIAVRNRNTDPSLIAMASLFLQRRFTQLLDMARQVQVEPPTSQAVDEDFIQTIGVALAGRGFSDGVRFFLRGSDADLDSARTYMSEAESVFASLGLVEESNLIRGVRSILPLMQQRSTWTVLGSQVAGHPRLVRYLKLLARGLGSDLFTGRSISELWPSQLAAINNGLLDSSTSKIVRMPTSAGKTRIAEMAIVSMLVTEPDSKCVYVAPYRALASEMQQSFVNLLSDLGFRVSSVIGTYESDDFEDTLLRDTDLLVTTPEKLDLLRRAQPELLRQVRLFVLDEAHILHDRQRGIKFELLLTRIKLSMPAARFLLLSAVVPDQTLEDFAQWFNSTPNEGILRSSWRPTVQRYARFEWKGSTGTIEYAPEDDIRVLREFVPGVIRQRNFEYRNPSTGRRKQVKFPDLTSKGQTAAELAFKFAELGSVLVFCSQASFVKSVANALVERISLAITVSQDMPPFYQGVFSLGRQESRIAPELIGQEMAYFSGSLASRSVTMAREWLGEQHPVTQWLESGVGVHYGALPDAVRNAVEADFRERKLHVLIATNTVAQGVNLPVRTVIIHSCQRRIDDRSVLVPARDYWNIAGRAGRAGQETQGLTLHIVTSPKDRENYTYYLRRRDNVEAVETALIQRLSDLVHERLSVEELGGEIDAEILALLAEEAEGLGQETLIETTFEATLTRIQAERRQLSLDVIKQVFIDVAKRVSQDIPDRELRRVYSYTGLSSTSCSSIRGHILANLEDVRRLFFGTSSSSELIELILPLVTSLSEMESEYEYSSNHGGLLASWVSGASLGDLARGDGGTTLTPDAQEDIAKMVDDLFRYRLPWGISGYIRIAQQVLSVERNAISESVRFLPSMVKFGLPNPAACWAMSIGIPFRRTAIQMAAFFHRESPIQGHERFRQWLSTLNTERLVRDFHLASPILDDVAQAVFTAAVNPLLRDLIDLDSLLPVRIQVQGIRYENRFVVALEAQVGQGVELVRDYDNLVDRNAILVTLSGQEMGFVPRNVAQILASEIDTGTEFVALVQAVEATDPPVVMIDISLVHEG